MTVAQTSTGTVDDVARSSRTGIQVVIVGAGIGGLMTALECWRKGNDVIILEKAEKISVIGDILAIGPSAWVTLQNYPKMAKDYDKFKLDTTFGFYSQQGELLRGPQEIEWNGPAVAKHASYPTRIGAVAARQDIVALLFNQVQRLGIKVEFGTNIIEFSEDANRGTATARAFDGREFTGDLVVAADGLGTKSHTVVLGRPISAVHSGYACLRGSFPTEAVQDVPTKTHLILTLTHQRVYVALTVQDDGTAEESWSKTISGSEIAAQLSSSGEWDKAVIDCFENAPDGCIVSWKLCWRDPQPKWTSKWSRIIQLGDSAHSFLPTSGNGGTMAVEDALSLAECLRMAGKADVPMASKVHETLRYRRVSLIQKTGFVNLREMHQDMKAIISKGSTPMLLGKWIWAHDPELYAKDNYEAARAAIETTTSFENSNLPPGHKWEPWTMAEELEKEASGVFFQDLKTNGDWGVLA
ncbi:FAD-binding domain protein [Colletotrichum tofieldiae]|uniref:FAD-binding domain protein n=1 Tax=Colletotrichum tofieldiae TaxID=708197 RepID=A0A166U747_9PEZI|nr:FAD-binding domain protein [Colletotrichum tofieldiae]